jgi:Domain of unknown function DUF29
MKDPQAAKSPGSRKRMVGDAERPHREHDFHAWVLDQARVLRAHRLAFVDWAGIAEELEAMGASERREIKSRLIVLTPHLLKWKYASTQRLEHERSWRKTIREQRRALSDLLADNPSLKTLPRTLISNTNLYRDHIRPDAMDDTGLDVFPAECPWRVDLTLASNFWPEL